MVASEVKAGRPVASSIQDIPLERIRESSRNPRRVFDEAQLQELATNIRSHGVLQAILVRPSPDGAVGTYELVAGARRFRASKIAGKDTIPATVRDLTDAECQEIRLIENLQRVNIHELDEGIGYRSLRDLRPDFYTMETIAAQVAKSPAYVKGRISLTELVPAAQTAFYDGKLTVAHGLEIARLQPLCGVRDYVVFNVRGPVITTRLRSGEHISHLRPNRCDEKRSERSLLAHQVEDSDFGRSAESDRKARGADATVDVELRAPLFVPSTGIPIQQVAEVQAAVDELKRQLPAMGVSGQHQIDAEVGCAVEHEHARFMA